MLDITHQNFEAELVEASLAQPVLLDIWAPWCGPCKTLGPTLEKLETDFAGRFKLVKLNADEEPEIAQQLGFPVCFVPHLLPVRRGLLATCYVQTDADVRSLLEAAYAGSPVVRVLPDGVAPELTRVHGTDTAEIGVYTDGATDTSIVICTLDNLGKGAAGQAIQNANLALGLDEWTGLRLNGVLV